MGIKVLKIHKVINCDKLRAFVDVDFGGEFTIKGFRVIEGPDGPWIGPPQTKYEQSGKTKYVSVVELSSRIEKELKDIVLKEYEIGHKSLS